MNIVRHFAEKIVGSFCDDWDVCDDGVLSKFDRVCLYFLSKN